MTGDIRSTASSTQVGGAGAASAASSVDVQLTMPDRLTRQPEQGLIGLVTLVIPIAVLLAFAVEGAEGSTIVLGPLAVFALAPTAMIAFWWQNWPGTRLRASWSGWADTLLIAAIAVLLTFFGQLLVGHFDVKGIFSPTDHGTHSPVFPITLPLAGAAFVTIMQLTFVCERWPFAGLQWMAGGLAALASSWAVALVLFFGLVSYTAHPGSGLRSHDGSLAPAQLGALLVISGAWQVLFYIAWEGWPFTGIARRGPRLLAGNSMVIGAGILTFLLAKWAGVAPVRMIALAGAFIAAVMVFGLLFDGWLPGSPSPTLRRLVGIVLDLVLAAILYVAINAYANHLTWTDAKPTEWVAHVLLNAIAFSTILHVAIGRRWPFGGKRAVEGQS